MLTLNEVVRRFSGVKKTGSEQYMAKCPCHDDRKASLAIGKGKNGGIVICCNAGCKTADVLDRVGLSFTDLAPEKTKGSKKQIVTTYEYRSGAEKVRYTDKSFTWRRPDGKGGYIWNRQGMPHELYVAGKPQGQVFIVEGEKDANNLSCLGYYCVSSENGAGKSNTNGGKWYKEYNKDLEGKDVCIIPDNDDPGRAFSVIIAKAIQGVAASVKILDLANVWPEIPNKGDISDMINALGSEETSKRLQQLQADTCNVTEKDFTSTDNSAAASAPGAAHGSVIAALDASIKFVNGEEVVNVKNTSGNYLKILRLDNHFNDVRFNLMRGYPEKVTNGVRRQWADEDDAEARTYIESEYGIFSRQKYDDAFRTFQHEREYHPVQDLINGFAWDKKPRCENFLSEILGADDTPYNRECSRLIFAGAISRAYDPGCKFDEVIVLVGNQGSGKSTICQWLALHKDFYASVKTISGTKGLEGVQGKWIVEIEELLAVLAIDKQGTKTEENAKAFLSSTADFYRKPYDRRPTDTPRTNIFIGTTNRTAFLTDLTGNRRWYPVYIKSDARKLYDRKAEVIDYMRQCYAEMKDAFDKGAALAAPVASGGLLRIIQEAQRDAEVEDWRVAAIESYVEFYNKVCIRQVFCEALYPNSFREQTKKDSNEIAEILIHKLGFVRGGVERFKSYGQCRAFYRKGSQAAANVN